MNDQFYEFIDHTADIGFVVRARSFRELCEKAALAMFDVMVDQSTVNPDRIYQVDVSADDREQLVVNWLNELIYLFEIQGALLKSFDVKAISDTGLKAECSGEEYKEGIHRIRKEIKAATYHQILVSEDRIGWTLRIIFDV